MKKLLYILFIFIFSSCVLSFEIVEDKDIQYWHGDPSTRTFKVINNSGITEIME